MENERKFLALLATGASRLSARQISGLSADQIGRLSADQISGLSARQIGRLSARGQRLHQQNTWGPDCDPETNLCKTPMCTAGHLVNMGGAMGYALKEKFGWELAATLIHRKARPDVPPQNFGGIPQEWAMAYIEERAAEEAKA